MLRRHFCLSMLAALAAPCAAQLLADEVAPGGPDLQTMLEKGLRARRPIEFQFIGNVVGLVNDGTLPQPIVEQCFLWARNKRPYPFPYFRQSLIRVAANAGVTVQ